MMSEYLYDLIGSKTILVILLIWTLISISWVSRWKAVLNRIELLLRKPIIFVRDPFPENVSIYPRILLETSSTAIWDSQRQSIPNLIERFSRFVRGQHKFVYDQEHPFRSIGYLMFLGSFIILLLVDAIVIAQTLELTGLLTGPLPPFLQNFDFAVFGGSLISLMIGFIIFSEIRAEDSELSGWSNRLESGKNLAITIALLAIVFSILNLLSFSMYRLIALGVVNSNASLDFFLNFALFGLAGITPALVASLVFPDSIPGFLIVLIFMEWLLIGCLYFLIKLAVFIGFLVVFLIDIALRLIYIVVDIFQWLIITPILVILLPFSITLGFLERRIE